MSNPSEDDRVPIRIQGPLPANVATVLMELIGSAWPDSMIQTNSDRHTDAMRKKAEARVQMLDEGGKPGPEEEA